MKPQMDIRIVSATEEDSISVKNFLQKYFFPDEPLNSSLGRLPEEIPFLDVLKNRLCFKAVNLLDNSEDNLLGVVLNKEVSLNDKKELNPNMCPKQLKIKTLLKELDQRAKIWDEVNNENHFNVVCVAVNNKHRGLKLGQKLVEESLKLAKSLGYKYASIECSSYYSAKFSIDLGFELLGEIPYDKYVDEKGEQIFKVREPHKAIKKLIKRL